MIDGFQFQSIRRMSLIIIARYARSYSFSERFMCKSYLNYNVKCTALKRQRYDDFIDGHKFRYISLQQKSFFALHSIILYILCIGRLKLYFLFHRPDLPYYLPSMCTYRFFRSRNFSNFNISIFLR